VGALEENSKPARGLTISNEPTDVMERAPVLELPFCPRHFSCTALSRNQRTFSQPKRVAETVIDDIVYYYIVTYYEELFNDMGVRRCTDSSGIG
jgi:hypothetical protein